MTDDLIQEVAPDEGQPMTKACFFCAEAIPIEAMKCRACGSHVGFWGGMILRQYFVLFFTVLAIFLGVTFFPWDSDTLASTYSPVPGFRTGQGSVIFFSTIVVLATSITSLWTRRFLFTPLLFYFIVGVVACLSRFMGVWQNPANNDYIATMFQGNLWDGLNRLCAYFGLGLVYCVLAFLFIPVYIVSSAISGAKKAKAGSGAEAAPARRSGAAGRRRS